MLSFGHLLGGNAKKATSASEDEEDKTNPKNTDDGDDKNKGKSNSKKANTEDDDGDDDGDGDSGKGKVKKANTEDGDDDNDDGGEEDKKEQGKKAERQRCAKIFSSPHAAGRADMAAHLAFNTNLSAKEAVGILASMPASSTSSRQSLDERMAQVGNYVVGADSKKSASGVNDTNEAKDLYLTLMGKK
ncbi:hypothetical protein RHO12_12710 (plasmid) [Orbus sturtevantii]|uniref:hypothetical protein n=1 Tax=Orbus sturtevantii TaxID=3074109 RepID=UPI00370DB3B0